MSEPTIREIDVHAAHAAGERGILLLDVREPGEWSLGHAPRAVHLPLGALPESLAAGTGPFAALHPGAEVVAVCRSGNRSGRAAVHLAAAGFDVANMLGGMNDWAAQGLPVVGDDGEPGSV